jgi:pimeloyl-ACP methyl ester carboxylesterase
MKHARFGPQEKSANRARWRRERVWLNSCWEQLSRSSGARIRTSRSEQGRLAKNNRLIALDLPGHGWSSDAPDPIRSYTLPAFADAAVAVFGKMGVTEAVVFGRSLRGHIKELTGLVESRDIRNG